MPFVVYVIVLLVAAGSVLFGLDWLQAPLPPTPPSQQVQVASAPAPPPATPAIQDTKPANAPPPVSLPRPVPTQAEPNAAQTNAIGSGEGGAPAAATGPDVATPAPAASSAEAATAAASARPLCDVDACANAYFTFRESDCTYQPSDGPRRLCKKGTPPQQDGTAAATQAPDARAQASCNIVACARAYQSFNAADCTYQPYDGPRRICTK